MSTFNLHLIRIFKRTSLFELSKDISAKLLRYRDVAYSVNRLPIEILWKIFELVRGEGYDASFFLSMPPPESLNVRSHSWIVISHVCQYWRQCAIGNPRLWRLIQIGDRMKRPGHLATMFLDRAEPLPITLYHERSNSPTERKSIDHFYAALERHLERISGIYLWGEFHKAAWNILKGDLPNVTEIGLSFILSGEEDYTPGGTLPRGYTPQLQKLSLTHFSWPTTPITNLTHLYLNDDKVECVSDQQMLGFLASCSQTLRVLFLKATCLQQDSSNFNRPSPNDSVQLPHLEHLGIFPASWDENPYCTPLIFHMLSLPTTTSLVWPSLDIAQADYNMNESGFPTREQCDGVQHVVLSLERQCCLLLEGDTVFASPTDFKKSSAWGLCNLCFGFPNVTVISIPPSWLESELAELLELLDEEFSEYVPAEFIFPPISELRVYTGESGDKILKKGTQRKISRLLLEQEHKPLDLSADYSMRRRDRRGNFFTLRFLPGHMTAHQILLRE